LSRSFIFNHLRQVPRRPGAKTEAKLATFSDRWPIWVPPSRFFSENAHFGSQNVGFQFQATHLAPKTSTLKFKMVKKGQNARLEIINGQFGSQNGHFILIMTILGSKTPADPNFRTFWKAK
jgi:hypothetical protein